MSTSVKSHDSLVGWRIIRGEDLEADLDDVDDLSPDESLLVAKGFCPSHSVPIMTHRPSPREMRVSAFLALAIQYSRCE
eukprot:scaffold27437_cov29-Attheya_sp.AAC.1